MNIEEFNKEAHRYRNVSSFGGQLGDLIIKLMSSLIGCPIIVMTSMESVPVIPFIPEHCISRNPIYIAYTQAGPGHYDGTLPRHTSDIFSTEEGSCQQLTEVKQTKSFCRCGNSRQKNINFTACGFRSGSKENTTAIYRSRCPCVKSKSDCRDCQCHNCANQFNDKLLSCSEHSQLRCSICKINTNGKTVEKSTNKRKRISRSFVKSKGVHFMEQKGEHVTQTGWISMEYCLLEVCMSRLATTSINANSYNVAKLYNYICGCACIVAMHLPLDQKSEKEIAIGINERRNKTILNMGYIGSQLNIQMKSYECR